MPDDDIVLIGNQGLEQRTSKSGKQRYTVRVSAEPIAANLSKEAMGGTVAKAIANHLRERVRGIAAVASPATLKAREVAAKAFAAGKPWAMKRYAGGRTGAMPPNQSNRAFNDSGRFAETIAANASKDGAWRVNVAANRLSGDPRMVERIWNRLVQLVPEFADASRLMSNDIVAQSLKRAQSEMLKKAKSTTRELQVAAVKGLFKAFRQIDDLLSA